jgi:tetratricopeptide (TPR) repeat protein
MEAYAHYYRADQIFSEMASEDVFGEMGRELRAALAIDPSFALAEIRLLTQSDGDAKTVSNGLLRLASSQRVPQRYRLQALAALRQMEGHTAEALALYRQAFELDPTDKHTAFDIGDTLLHVYGDREGAQRWFDRVLQLDPRYTRALGHSAWSAADERRYDRMLYWAKRRAEIVPRTPAGGLLVARAQEALGQIEDAERTLLDLQQRFPKKSDPTVSLAELHWRQGDFMRAEADLAPLLKADRRLEDQRDGLRALAHLDARRGRFAQAFLRFDEIAELSRRAVDPEEAAVPFAEKAFWLAFVRGDLPKARAALEAAMRDVRTPVGDALAVFAHPVALALGEQEKARALAAALRGYRSLAEAGAFAAFAEGRRNDAIEILQRLAKSGHGPEQVVWSYQLARWALDEKRPEIAIEYLEWMPRVLPSPGGNAFDYHTGEQDAFYAPSLFLLGKALEMRGETRRAVDAYSQFLEIWKDADPDEPRPAEARARLAALNAVGTSSTP